VVQTGNRRWARYRLAATRLPAGGATASVGVRRADRRQELLNAPAEGERSRVEPTRYRRTGKIALDEGNEV